MCVFLRYFERIPLKEYDVFDKTLECVKLEWSRKPFNSEDNPNSEQNNDEVVDAVDSAYLEVLTAGTILGLLHIVRGDYELSDAASYTNLGMSA